MWGKLRVIGKDDFEIEEAGTDQPAWMAETEIEPHWEMGEGSSVPLRSTAEPQDREK